MEDNMTTTTEETVDETTSAGLDKSTALGSAILIGIGAAGTFVAMTVKNKLIDPWLAGRKALKEQQKAEAPVKPETTPANKK